MALYQFLCGLTVMLLISSKGCQSEEPRCGVAPQNTRIVGGQDASPGTWPWQVSLNNDFGLICGGSLISDKWVLTAAHCFEGETGEVQAYLGRLRQSGPNPDEVSRGIDEVIIHPLYDNYTIDNDICLLKLSAPVNFTNNIFPVCLAAANSFFHSGTSSWVTGWGSTANDSSPDILQEVNVPIVGNNECRCAHPELTENMICAGLRAGGKDSCQGDSGGPLVTKDGSIWVQSGVVSFGDGCAKPMSPGVYARVSQYQDWITSHTGSSTPGFVTFTSSGTDSDLNVTCPTSLPMTTTTISTHEFTDKDGDSIFDGAENLIHFSYFSRLVSVCVPVLSFLFLLA